MQRTIIKTSSISLVERIILPDGQRRIRKTYIIQTEDFKAGEVLPDIHFLTKLAASGIVPILYKVYVEAVDCNVQHHILEMEDLGQKSLHDELRAMQAYEFNAFVHKHRPAWASMLKILSENGIVHGDLWPQNVVRCEDAFKIIDFEMAYEKHGNRREDVRPYTHVDDCFDLFFFTFTIAVSYQTTQEDETWWRKFARFQVDQAEFAHFKVSSSPLYRSLLVEEDNNCRIHYRMPRFAKDGKFEI